MKLTKKSEYTCLALIDLSENYGKGVVKIVDISKRKDIPKKYLEQILLLLKGAGYVKSKRGAEGGYKLAKSPDKVSVAEILRLTGGALASVDSVSKHFYEPSPIESNKKLVSLFRRIRLCAIRKLEKTTFSDLVE